ncbi:phage holin family protein [Pseudomonas sp. 7-41]|uniref:phage holin family protein n=1 Tax=Pseudomonas sp. 7-41 TaxID=2898483 RepID=UPI001E558DE2|nr:phage holin family protein [Pseudomonas sp. 7-41]UHG99188.1 phage holin family protein [Pseudomonas sp. 7-41]
MVDPWTFAAAAICGAICFRITVYQRQGARYRAGVSWCAYALAAATGCEWLSVMLAILLAKPATAVSPFILIVLLVLAVLVYRAGGNVARILRMD